MPFIGDDGEFLNLCGYKFREKVSNDEISIPRRSGNDLWSSIGGSWADGLPDFSIEKSCSLFAGHPRPLVLCQDTESRYRGEVASSWAQTPVLEREACVKLASQSQRGNTRCSRAVCARLSRRPLERRRRIHQAIRD